MANRVSGPDPAHRTKRTTTRDKKFFEGLARGWSITKAAAHAGYGRTTVFEYKDADPEFAARWEDAHEQGTDLIEDSVRDRVTKGVARDVYYKGEVVGTEYHFSDSLAPLILGARRPDKYRQRSTTELTGPNGAPLPAPTTNLTVEFADAPTTQAEPAPAERGRRARRSKRRQQP